MPGPSHNKGYEEKHLEKMSVRSFGRSGTNLKETAIRKESMHDGFCIHRNERH
jgi:hypothetical protein